MHLVEPFDSHDFSVEESDDCMINVDQNLFRLQNACKFPGDGAFRRELDRTNGMLAVHPITGIIADYVYLLNEIHFVGIDGVTVKVVKLNGPLVTFQWMDESLLCYSSNFQMQIIDYRTCSITTYNLASAMNRNTEHDVVVSSMCIGKNSHVYCMLSSGELFEFFGWKRDGSFQILIYESGIRFCVELCAVGPNLLYGYNKAWLYQIEISDSATKATKLTESLSIVSPLYGSLANPNIIGFVIADEKDNSACCLKVYHTIQKEYKCSFKLSYLPEEVIFFANDSILVANKQSFTLINQKHFKEVDCFERIQIVQLIHSQCLIISQSGIDLLSFSSKLLERLKENIKKSVPFSPNELSPSVKMLETIFEVANNEWNLKEQRILTQVAQQLTCFLSSSEYNEQKIEKCTKFINQINLLRKTHKIGCFCIQQTNIELLIDILLEMKLTDIAIELFSIFSFSLPIAEKVFLSWLMEQSEQTLNQYEIICQMQNKLSIPTDKLTKILQQNEKKELLLQLLPVIQSEQFSFSNVSQYSQNELVKILQTLSNECKISQCYELVEILIKEYKQSLKVKLFTIFIKNRDVSRFFEDYCLYHSDLWSLLSNFYYAFDHGKLQKKIDRLISSGITITTSKQELIRMSEKLQEFQIEISCANAMPEVLNMSFLETTLLVRSSSNSIVIRIFEENFPLSKSIR